MSLLEEFVDIFSGFLVFLPLIGISALAFWKDNPVFFMIAFGLSWMIGLNAPNIISGNEQTTTAGIAVGMMMIYYGMFCAGMSFKYSFWGDYED